MENSENFAQLFEESSTRQETRSGEVITAEVVAIDRNHVVLNANLKSDALIPREEFVNIQGELEVSVGDFVKVVIEQLEDGFGNTKLSRQKAKVQEAWVFLEKALEEGITVTGKVLNRVRGGLSVLVNGVKAFLPGSLVDVRLLKDTTDLEGQILDFKVVKIDRKRTNVVLSRKAVLEENSITDKAKAAEILQEGALVSGVVKAITDYGAFVEFNDIKGINGLIHITDLSWKRVRHPSEIISVEQAITAKVLRYDEERNRVSLGLKQLSEDPWIGIARRYPAGTRMFGKVTNITDYGAFVEIETGIEGLVHVTEMEWSNKNIVPSKLVTVGQEVEVMVLEIDEDRRRISLGMKQCKANPWEEFELNHKKGDKVKGVIKSITDFGLFLGLPGNIDGLVHLTDLSWTQPGEEA
ncbi:MAG: 30S ribosomal protein S1, partial [Rhodocyclaceae bacterium]